jgi:hypothetical protein
MQQEEDILFPLVDSTLPAAEDDRVVLAMKTYDKQWQDRKLPGLLRRLDKLAAKYPGKSRTRIA